MGKIIFELSGLPGSGKTTLLKHLRDELSNCEILYDYQFYRKQDKILNKLRTICYWLMPDNREANEVLAKLGRECISRNNKMKFFKKQLNCIRCMSLYRKYSLSSHIAISEGLIQALLELLDYVDEGAENIGIKYCAELFHMFRQEFPYVRFITLKTGVNEANLRVKHRNDKRNSVDNLCENKRILFLEKRCRNIDALLESIDTGQNHIFILYSKENIFEVYEKFQRILDGMGSCGDS